jgi:hypothetical protein
VNGSFGYEFGTKAWSEHRRDCIGYRLDESSDTIE